MSIFRMDSNFEKINFCNFFRSFLSPRISPFFFPFRGYPSHTTSPIKITCISSIYLPFQGATFAGKFPSKTYGESFSQNIVLFAKIPYFLLQISACPGVRTGGVRGVNGDKFRDFSAKASPWKGEIGERLGVIWGQLRGEMG